MVMFIIVCAIIVIGIAVAIVMDRIMRTHNTQNDGSALCTKSIDRVCIPNGFKYREREEPTAEPKTGHWILKSHMWECDKCGCRIRRANPFKGNIWNYNYCPNCGDKKEELS